jgi:hypothetical protein
MTAMGDAALAAEPLAKFEVQERLGLAWARTLITYSVDSPVGRARPEKLRLEYNEGEEQPVQFSAVRLHKDGSIASARLSFMADLKKGASWSYRLVPGEPGTGACQCNAVAEEDFLTLDNGVTAVRLSKPGRHEFQQPLRFGSGHIEMIRLYGKQVRDGVAPGPLRAASGASPGRWPVVQIPRSRDYCSEAGAIGDSEQPRSAVLNRRDHSQPADTKRC